LLKDEVDRTLAQIGCPSVSQLSPDYVMADGPPPCQDALAQREAESQRNGRELVARGRAITARQI
jgi:hypothetical protein